MATTLYLFPKVQDKAVRKGPSPLIHASGKLCSHVNVPCIQLPGNFQEYFVQ